MAKKPNPDLQIMKIEVGEYVNLKSQLEAYKLGELITLPKFLNVRDYNGLCAYLKEQREYLTKEPAEVPDKITELEAIVLPMVEGGEA